MPTRLYTVKESAETLREHPDTTRERLRTGELKGVKKGSLAPGKLDRRSWHVTESALEHYIRKSSYEV
jgi:hypothetical protein